LLAAVGFFLLVPGRFAPPVTEMLLDGPEPSALAYSEPPPGMLAGFAMPTSADVMPRQEHKRRAAAGCANPQRELRFEMIRADGDASPLFTDPRICLAVYRLGDLP
jgi:hypothetical protein